MRTNLEFSDALKGTPEARFYLCDFHVHSPASMETLSKMELMGVLEEGDLLIEEINQIVDPVEYEKKVQNLVPVENYFGSLLSRRDEMIEAEERAPGENWSFVAITDHNVCGYAAILSQYAWERRNTDHLIVLPGMELEVTFPVSEISSATAHILCIFPPCTEEAYIVEAINRARDTKEDMWRLGENMTTDDLPKFIKELRNHSDYPAICIAAHSGTTKGIQEETKEALLDEKKEYLDTLDAEIARIEGALQHGEEPDTQTLVKDLQKLSQKRSRERDVSLEVLKLIGACGFDALQVKGQHEEKHYRRLHRYRKEYGRAVPIIASDAHVYEDVFACESNIPYIKIDGMSGEKDEHTIWKDLRYAIRFGETRFGYTSQKPAVRWISGVEISREADDASRFWPLINGENGSSFMLEFSRNLNCLIGGRGSGKSAVIEALGFLTDKFPFGAQIKRRPDDREDWFKRAKATLDGCYLKICWKSLDESGADLKKRSFFVSRYFNPTEKYEPVVYSDLDEKELVSGQFPHTGVQLFRMHDIEKAVESDKLREIFDDICGKKIKDLQLEIDQTVLLLQEQREEVLKTARKIFQLTAEDTPLRQYAVRKYQYEQANKPEVREQFIKVDEASAAEKAAIVAETDWEEVKTDFDLDSRRKDVNNFFDRMTPILLDEKEQVIPYQATLHGVLMKGKKEDEDAPLKRTIDAIDNLENEVNRTAQDIEDTKNPLTEIHQNRQQELAQKGLPAGAKDREAKKKAFEEAEEKLEEYKGQLEQFWNRLNERQELFNKLVNLANERSNLRKETAEKITDQLKRDLDPSVLVIEADAQTLADKDTFWGWIREELTRPCFSKGYDPRVKGLMGKGLFPQDIFSFLLGMCPVIGPNLVVNPRGKVSEGRITEEEEANIVKICRAAERIGPDTSQEHFGVDFFNDLPNDIQKGLWTFYQNEDKGDLKLDSVLKLHEIVFDDKPVILMNDRPSEPGTKLRPLEELSAGQRCSAVLPILLLNGTDPLIIDQPEDNLDNRLIRQVIVNILASIKLRRQVIVATHNPNLPVLGDAEQVIILRAIGEKECHLDDKGNIDSDEIIRYITDIMEGGREAFQYRHSIYSPHWKEPS